MTSTATLGEEQLGALLDQIAAVELAQSNCMFQLALMLGRVALEPCPESYKEETAQALLALLRAKPKGNVVRLFASEAKQPRWPGQGPVGAATASA